LDIDPKIGAVIVNYVNYPDTVKYVKDHLLDQKDIILEIVIVDNNSPNESYEELLNEFRSNTSVNIIRSECNRGYAAGNNLGIKYLEIKECDYILVTNNDIEIEDNFLLSKLYKAYLSLDKAAFISPVMMVDGKISTEFSAWKLPNKTKEILSSTRLCSYLARPFLKRFFYQIEIEREKSIKVDCISGSFFLGAASLFRQIDYFDDNTFLYYEENILGEKVKRLNMNNYLYYGGNYSHIQGCSVNSVYSFTQKQSFLCDSKIYYWKEYHKASDFFCKILELLYYLNKTEHKILRKLHIVSEITPASNNWQKGK
jgi:GT2 family glycosyltransferase